MVTLVTKKKTVASLALALALTFSGCGDDGGSSTGSLTGDSLSGGGGLSSSSLGDDGSSLTLDSVEYISYAEGNTYHLVIFKNSATLNALRSQTAYEPGAGDSYVLTITETATGITVATSTGTIKTNSEGILELQQKDSDTLFTVTLSDRGTIAAIEGNIPTDNNIAVEAPLALLPEAGNESSSSLALSSSSAVIIPPAPPVVVTPPVVTPAPPAASSASAASSSSDLASSSSETVAVNGSVTYGGQTYKTVKIGTQTWMAENLNYAVEGSRCYGDEPANCAVYGRLYDWVTAMNVDSLYYDKYYVPSSNHRGICPAGWHLPDSTEWSVLYHYADENTPSDDKSLAAGGKLKAMNGWDSNGNLIDGPVENGNGTDDYGFAGLPGGAFSSNNNAFQNIGWLGSWWSTFEWPLYRYEARYYVMTYYNDKGHWFYQDKTELHSIRCVKD